MNKFLKLLAVLAAFTMLAASCGSDSPAASVTEAASDAADAAGDAAGDAVDAVEEVVEDAMEDDAMEEDMITHSDDGPFWSVVQKGAQAAADDVGVTLLWRPGNNDPGQMVVDIEAAIAEGSDGIAASLPSPDQLIPPLQDAVAAGINVYTLNSGVNDYQSIGATSHIGQTEFIAGQGAGNRFNDLGATHVLCGRQEQSNVGLDERCAGLADTFNGDVTNEFVGLDADQTEQINGIKAILEAEPSIDGFLGVGPVIAVNGLTASDDLGRGLIIGGFDVTPDIIDAIEGGQIAFTVDQQQYLQGYLPVILMYLQATNQNTAGGGLPILTGPGFITPENAAEVKALVAQGTR